MAKLLLVEDNEPNRKLLVRRLTGRGYEVIEAADGQESIEQATAELPDLILMDMNLPIIDGWEATRQLKAAPATAHIPIIALTAHAMVGDRKRTLAIGCDEYETKPIRLPRLIEKIENFFMATPTTKSKETSSIVASVEEATPTPNELADVPTTVIEQPSKTVEESTTEPASPITSNLESSGETEMTLPTPAQPSSSIEPNDSALPLSNHDEISADQTFETALDNSAPSPPQASQSQATILVVDDILNNRNLLIRRLGRKGYTVIAVESGPAALEAIANTPSIDLVLLDIMMPGMDGIETLSRIRQTHPSHELPVIMATAKDASRDMVQAFGKGANDYITKPIDFPLALARIQAQLTMVHALQGNAPESQYPQSAPAPLSTPTTVPATPIVPTTAPPAVKVQEIPNIRLVSPPPKAVVQSAQKSASSEEGTQVHPSLPDRFQCLEALEQDSFGVTALVTDTDQIFIRRNCLLEEIKPSTPFKLARKEEQMRQLLTQQQQELQAIRDRGLNTRFIDVIEQEGNYYILHKMHKGESLQARLSRQTQPDTLPDTLKLMAALLRAINPLHQKNFAYSYLRMQDFHYLANTDDLLILTNSGLRQRLLWGTVANMKDKISAQELAHVAPEARQGNPSCSSDFYSIGIMGLQALTGKPASQLPMDSQGIINWEEILESSNVARPIFQKLLSLSPQERFLSTQEAINEIMKLWFKQSHLRVA